MSKEKAIDLVDKIYNSLPQWVNRSDAKECAIIHCKEVIDLLQHDLGHDATAQGLLKEYEQTIEEIKKL